jgi:hypothetical protein
MPEAAHSQPDGIIGVFSRAAPTYDRIGPRIFALQHGSCDNT